MSGARFPLFREKRKGSQINRAPSPILALSLPWVSIMLASMAPGWLFIASAPAMPPLGFLTIAAWRQLRPGLLPVWAGLPLGLFDDLFSGQPFGSGVLLWSLAMLVFDIVETRVPWRNYVMEGLVASAVVTTYLALSLLLANAGGGSTRFMVLLPQIAISIMLCPLVARIVAWLDRVRLTPFREVA